MALLRTLIRWSLPTLTAFLGFFFVFSGGLKLFPVINREIHREIRRNFVQYTKVIPFAKELNIKITSTNYRLFVGWTEVFCGFVFVFAAGAIKKKIVNIFLVIFMAAAIYTHHAIGDNIESKFFFPMSSFFLY